MNAAAFLLALLALAQSKPAPAGLDAAKQKAIESFASEWFQARPATAFEEWDSAKRQALLEKAKSLDPIPAPAIPWIRDALWKAARKFGPKLDPAKPLETKWGKGSYFVGNAGKDRGFLLGLHGGGPGAGDKGEAAGNWSAPLAKSKLIGVFPQAIQLVHDAWNTVEGERFAITLLEMAKRTHDIDPDRVFTAGFSMGGTGSWFLAGRHPDLFAGAMPFHGVIFVEKEGGEIRRIHHGLVPNVRHVPLYYTTGEVDANCPPESYLFAEKLLSKLREDHGGDYEVNFRCVPGLAHAFPPGEPEKAFAWMLARKRKTFPKTLTWEYTADPFPQDEGRLAKRDFYWLHCKEPSENMKIEGKIEGQTVNLQIERRPPSGFAVYLGPELLDCGKEVVLTVNGEKKFQGQLQPTLTALIETMSSRFDRSMVYAYRIEF